MSFDRLLPAFFFDLSNYEHKELFYGCNYVWEALSRLQVYLKDLSSEINCSIPSGAHIINRDKIFIGEGSIVEPGAYIKGPCIIGKKCTIRHGAYIRGNLITGDSCVIGHDTEVKNSIFLNHAKAAHFAYVGDSILGNHTNLGAGTKCANLKLDNSNVSVHISGEQIETGRRKLGAIVGDNAQTGCNSVTNPGTFLGKGAICYPNTNVNGIIPPKNIVKNRSPAKIIERQFK